MVAAYSRQSSRQRPEMKMCSMHNEKDDTVAKIRRAGGAKREAGGLHGFYLRRQL